MARSGLRPPAWLSLTGPARPSGFHALDPRFSLRPQPARLPHLLHALWALRALLHICTGHLPRPPPETPEVRSGTLAITLDSQHRQASPRSPLAALPNGDLRGTPSADDLANVAGVDG